LEIDPETKQALVSHVKRKLAPQPVKIRSDVEVTCFSYEGIDAIKEYLQVKTVWINTGAVNGNPFVMR
jgi:translation initiation factor 2 subunit 1